MLLYEEEWEAGLRNSQTTRLPTDQRFQNSLDLNSLD